MKYTIYGYRQDVSFELGLYFDELAILRYFDDFRRTGKMYSEEVDGKTYYWVIYEKIAEDSTSHLCKKHEDEHSAKQEKMQK